MGLAQLLAVLLAVAGLTWLPSSHAVIDRHDVFFGYKESQHAPAGCTDQRDCADRSLHNACVYNPYTLRTQECPVACGVEQCISRGTLQVVHAGHATPSGTARLREVMLAQHQQSGLPESFYRRLPLPNATDGYLYLSSLGTGTYLGDLDQATDTAVVNALLLSITHGWNVIDTASNYRWGRGEAAVGEALDAVLRGNAAASFGNQHKADIPQHIKGRGGADIMRDMLLISTKVGFTAPDLLDHLIQTGAMSQQDVVGGVHTLHAAYIKASLEESLARMRISTVDVLYLHNAAEAQLPTVKRQVFMQRLTDAFKACEELRAAGKIVSYGLATWDSLRSPPSSPLHLRLEEVVAVAQAVGGVRTHGFRWIQAPVNAGMLEAAVEPWQKLGPDHMTLLEVAQKLHVAVMTSGPFAEGSLLGGSSSEGGTAAKALGAMLGRDAPRLLQFARSTPGVMTTLVGHKARDHVEANLEVSLKPPLSVEQWEELLAPGKLQQTMAQA